MRLVEKENIIKAPMHLKLLRLMKNFVNTLDKEGACSKCLREKFLNMAEGIFVRRRI